MFNVRTMFTLRKRTVAGRGCKETFGTRHQVYSAHENSLAVQLGIVHLFYIKQDLPGKKKQSLLIMKVVLFRNQEHILKGHVPRGLGFPSFIGVSSLLSFLSSQTLGTEPMSLQALLIIASD